MGNAAAFHFSLMMKQENGFVEKRLKTKLENGQGSSRKFQMRNSKFQIFFSISALLFLGAGCEQEIISDKTPEQSAAELNITTGAKIELQETVLGIGGKFVNLFQGTDAPRVVKIEEFAQNNKISAVWERSFEQETTASKEVRDKYFEEFKTAPIGTQLPTPPEPVYETITEKGNLETSDLKEGTKILLPMFWKKDETVGDETTLIWLSQKQYQELIQTRHTEIHLGLFDDSIATVTGFFNQLELFVDKIKSVGQDAVSNPITIQPSDSSTIEAAIDWKTYRLLVNGKLTDVRAIQAQNAFAKYTILANEENPLILEIVLTPASRGSVNLFNQKSFGEAFAGYEITKIGL